MNSFHLKLFSGGIGVRVRLHRSAASDCRGVKLSLYSRENEKVTLAQELPGGWSGALLLPGG
jgi:hypothetical protein